MRSRLSEDLTWFLNGEISVVVSGRKLRFEGMLDGQPRKFGVVLTGYPLFLKLLLKREYLVEGKDCFVAGTFRNLESCHAVFDRNGPVAVQGIRSGASIYAPGFHEVAIALSMFTLGNLPDPRDR